MPEDDPQQSLASAMLAPDPVFDTPGAVSVRWAGACPQCDAPATMPGGTPATELLECPNCGGLESVVDWEATHRHNQERLSRAMGGAIAYTRDETILETLRGGLDAIAGREKETGPETFDPEESTMRDLLQAAAAAGDDDPLAYRPGQLPPAAPPPDSGVYVRAVPSEDLLLLVQECHISTEEAAAYLSGGKTAEQTLDRFQTLRQAHGLETAALFLRILHRTESLDSQVLVWVGPMVRAAIGYQAPQAAPAPPGDASPAGEGETAKTDAPAPPAPSAGGSDPLGPTKDCTLCGFPRYLRDYHKNGSDRLRGECRFCCETIREVRRSGIALDAAKLEAYNRPRRLQSVQPPTYENGGIYQGKTGLSMAPTGLPAARREKETGPEGGGFLAALLGPGGRTSSPKGLRLLASGLETLAHGLRVIADEAEP